MRRLLQFLGVALVAVSCSPMGHVMTLDVRQPSQSGLEASGKTLSIVYLESENGADSVFNNKVADAMAIALEEDYFDGEQAIGIYRATKDPKGNYMAVDTLIHYVMTLDSDVVMLLDTPAITTETADGPKKQRSSLYVYDSRGKDDVIVLNCDIKAQERLTASTAMVVGQNLAGPLKSQWKTEMYTLIYYDGFDTRWIKALEAAEDMKWDDAISIWLDLVKTNDIYASSSAMYNIAMGCYMLKEYELADEWIRRSDETHVLSLSDGMHKRIDAELKK